METEEVALQERIKLDQEDSRKILAIGHKIIYEGNAYIIGDIRIWHDLDSMVPGEKRYYPVCDLASESTGRRLLMNVHIDELALWKPPIRLQASAIPHTRPL